MPLSEAALLAHIYDRSKRMAEGVLVGPGDDAAVVRVGDTDVLLTVDQFVEGRHFDPKTVTNEWIARSALGRSVSDIAAMGGTPNFALAAATIGPNCPDADALFDALALCAQTMSVPLVGGDIAMSDGPTVLSVTVVGTPHATRGPVLRSGAGVGDRVYVTGRLGAPGASGYTTNVSPRLSEGRWLCDALGERLTAMIDISDGLGRDGGRIARASGVRVVVVEQQIPLAAGATLEHAIGGGEEYELLFTARGEAPDSCPTTGRIVTCIGDVVAGEGCALRMRDGAARDISETGWDHTLP